MVEKVEELEELEQVEKVEEVIKQEQPMKLTHRHCLRTRQKYVSRTPLSNAG
jgi:hypothetical protein